MLLGGEFSGRAIGPRHGSDFVEHRPDSCTPVNLQVMLIAPIYGLQRFPVRHHSVGHQDTIAIIRTLPHGGARSPSLGLQDEPNPVHGAKCSRACRQIC